MFSALHGEGEKLTSAGLFTNENATANSLLPNGAAAPSAIPALGAAGQWALAAFLLFVVVAERLFRGHLKQCLFRGRVRPFVGPGSWLGEWGDIIVCGMVVVDTALRFGVISPYFGFAAALAVYNAVNVGVMGTPAALRKRRCIPFWVIGGLVAHLLSQDVLSQHLRDQRMASRGYPGGGGAAVFGDWELQPPPGQVLAAAEGTNGAGGGAGAGAGAGANMQGHAQWYVMAMAVNCLVRMFQLSLLGMQFTQSAAQIFLSTVFLFAHVGASFTPYEGVLIIASRTAVVALFYWWHRPLDLGNLGGAHGAGGGSSSSSYTYSRYGEQITTPTMLTRKLKLPGDGVTYGDEDEEAELLSTGFLSPAAPVGAAASLCTRILDMLEPPPPKDVESLTPALRDMAGLGEFEFTRNGLTDIASSTAARQGIR
jgi:hypothetical protein